MSNPNPIVTTNIKPGTTSTRTHYNQRSSIALVNGRPTTSISRSLIFLSDYLCHNHDVVSIKLETVPQNLINVVLTIGAQPVATVVRKDIEPGKNVLETFMYDPYELLPLSKCPLMETWLEFNFDNDLSDLDPSAYYYKTEETRRRVLSEEEVTIYNEDEGCCMSGKQVLGYEVDKIQIIHFVLPKITVESREAYYQEYAEERTKTTAYVKVWEKILITRSNFTEELLEKYIQNYELCTDNCGNVIEMYRALDDTPSRIENARGNVTLPLESTTFVGDLNRQRCKNVFVSNVNKVVFGQGDAILHKKTHENAKRSDEFEAKLVNQIRFGEGMAGVSHRF
jgi:hypothetical protein